MTLPTAEFLYMNATCFQENVATEAQEGKENQRPPQGKRQLFDQGACYSLVLRTKELWGMNDLHLTLKLTGRRAAKLADGPVERIVGR
jgi:hypothetical protein